MPDTTPEISQEAAVTDVTAISAEINRRFEARAVRDFGSFTVADQLKALRCADGFKVSVQASSTHRCWPREDCGPYREVECGYPTAPMPSLGQWIEEGDPATMTDTVWGYVPLVEIAKVLAEHGGLLPIDATEGRAS